MELFTAEQIRRWDQYTMKHEPVSSLDLMERAAAQCTKWLVRRGWHQRSVRIFCGKGNNGGDGLAMARQLLELGVVVEIFILESGQPGSEDFQANLRRLRDLTRAVSYIQSAEDLPVLGEGHLVVDALFGSGLNKPLSGLAAAVVAYLNAAPAPVVSIDIPSGLFLDRSSRGLPAVQADYTLTFQVPKLAFLVAENAAVCGVVQVLDIGLHPGFLEQETSPTHLLDAPLIRQIYRPRPPFAHKGTFGHALLVGGSYGKMGALVLATAACLRAGAGRTTAYVPGCGQPILQTTLPEAMVMTDPGEMLISGVPDALERFQAIGLGPGLGTEAVTQQVVGELMGRCTKPLVVDADGLNCLALHPALLERLPPYSILTPHSREFERLFGPSATDFERIEAARTQAQKLRVVLVLKGHRTLIATPSGLVYFNSTGNAGMAKGGSGDVLTGIVTALVAQGYDPLHAALLGVYVHGLAGDLAARQWAQEAMLARDIVEKLGAAFLHIAGADAK